MPPLWTLTDAQLPGRLQIERLSIEPGLTVLLGASGAGKSTLLECLLGLQTAGAIASNLPDHRPLPCYWTPQRGGLWSGVSAREHLDAAAAGDLEPTARDEIVATLGLPELLERTPEQLSQGQRARLALARSLVARPSVQLMDEPLAHLDPETAEAAWHLIRARLAADDASLLVASHQPARWLACEAQAIALAAGAVVASGALAELYDRPPSAAIGQLLGPLNWLDPWEPWLSEAPAHPSLRPEQLTLVADEASPIEATHSERRGAYQATTLRAGERALTLLHGGVAIEGPARVVIR